MSQKVLVVGSGGREHALAWKLAQSRRVGEVFVAPGNGGTGEVAKNIPIDAMDIRALARFAKDKGIDLTVVGPDDPLAAGIVDFFQANDLAIFGPTQAAACIESSKAFAKNLMVLAGVPTANYEVFETPVRAAAYVSDHGVPLVIKADGLAKGKGVYVCKSTGQAIEALRKIMVEREHGQAGQRVVIEDYLYGQEVSAHILCDGFTFKPLLFAQDHKPLCDNDHGSNTGGMGAFAPVPWLGEVARQQIANQVVSPILDEMVRGRRRFSGLLYPGLKITTKGPKVVEFNARFGDPEAQVLMRLLATDLLDLLEACAHEALHGLEIKWWPGFAACVAMVSRGYPGDYQKGYLIHGLDEAKKVPGVEIFHAGTVRDGEHFKTAGGRVVHVTAIGQTLQEALDRAYEAVRLISFEGMHYRGDIGRTALAIIQ